MRYISRIETGAISWIETGAINFEHNFHLESSPPLSHYQGDHEASTNAHLHQHPKKPEASIKLERYLKS